MNLYLSSFRIGHRAADLRRLAAGRPIGFVPNALDAVEPTAGRLSNARSAEEVRAAGLALTTLDLSRYFDRPDALREALADLGGVWVRGGNTFVLRQAMRLSGFDQALVERFETDFLYAGYSAGVCVLAPRLEGIRHVDDPEASAYPGVDVIWEGLGVLDYLVLPHFESDHHESEAIGREVEYCTAEGIPFRTLRDGEVIVLEDYVPKPAV